MFVKLWMTSNVLTVTSVQPIIEVEQIMRENRVRRVPVVDGGKLVGIISREDLFRAMPSIFDPSISPETLDHAGRIEAASVMTPAPVTVEPATPLEHAALLMRSHKFGALPVVKGTELVGIITETNIFDAFLEVLGARKSGARIEMKIAHAPATFYTMLQVFKKNAMTILGITVYPDFSEEHQLVTVKVQGENIEQLIDALWEAGLQINRLNKEGSASGEEP
ncbi:CBS and ACT domain-containing protein [Desulfobulbus alkaliphilus]|uniref:CBS and ACT domain-containing protein n=1 Tax=Desulfobulbus alkaliphilus TaxID=869814 RepID=UPI0019652A2A|nr:CBS and ACT domain-containing protein [Desulfobulbus alkaliphilus]MBM9537805.1 CBS domain-containing protein [Desulfobulbus alkaliphilus]